MNVIDFCYLGPARKHRQTHGPDSQIEENVEGLRQEVEGWRG